MNNIESKPAFEIARLLMRLPVERIGTPSSRDEQLVTSLSIDSRKIGPGTMFFAIRGVSRDAHEFLPEVFAKAPAAVIVERDVVPPSSYNGALFRCPSSRFVLGEVASRFFCEPSAKLFCVGVTGTNGKTTITHLIEAILNRGAKLTGVIGTIDHHLAGRSWPSELTTPDPIRLQSRLVEFIENGARALAMEVSSHALQQDRVTGVQFDTCVFSNLTRDHLDFHPTVEDYFEAKQKLFAERLSSSPKKQKTAVINIDDAFGRRIQMSSSIRKWTYGRAAAADFEFQVLEQSFAGSRFFLSSPAGSKEFFIPLVGVFNVYNAVAATAAAVSAGVDLQVAQEALQNFSGVPGRMQSIANDQGISIFVDYAHTDDALRNVLGTLANIRGENCPASRIITVFGCGGDRDRGKRPEMLKAAREVSDVVVVTSDNPRTEDPEQILDEILAGVPSAEFGQSLVREVDRKSAIHKALSFARKGDVVMIAGKGHENYQILGEKKISFSDAEVAMEFLK